MSRESELERLLMEVSKYLPPFKDDLRNQIWEALNPEKSVALTKAHDIAEQRFRFMRP